MLGRLFSPGQVGSDVRQGSGQGLGVGGKRERVGLAAFRLSAPPRDGAFPGRSRRLAPDQEMAIRHASVQEDHVTMSPRWGEDFCPPGALLRVSLALLRLLQSGADLLRQRLALELPLEPGPALRGQVVGVEEAAVPRVVAAELRRQPADDLAAVVLN